MKKILLVIVVIVVIAIAAMLGLGLGFGNGSGAGKEDGKTNTVQEESKTEESEKSTETETEEDGNNGVVIKVSVVGNEYFYENERIALDDFISKVKDMEGDFVIEVKDDNASLRAYNNIIESLEELKVSITEK